MGLTNEMFVVLWHSLGQSCTAVLSNPKFKFAFLKDFTCNTSIYRCLHVRR